MLSIVMRFLSPDKKALLQMALRMFDNLDTSAERMEVARFIQASFRDGKIATTEWSTLGKLCGILTGPSAGKNGDKNGA
jgi:hypothetical protein